MVPFRGVAGALFPSTARLLSMASRVVDLRVRDRGSIERMLRSTGSSLDGRGVELYRRLSERPEHVAAVLAMMARWDLEPLFAELPGLTARALLLAGASDRAVPVVQQRAVASRMPHARLVIVDGAGHLLHEEQPTQVARLILAEVDAAAKEREL
jgi:magnesium chelatase accessory protein